MKRLSLTEFENLKIALPKGLEYCLGRKPVKSDFQSFALKPNSDLYFQNRLYGTLVGREFVPLYSDLNSLIQAWIEKGVFVVEKRVILQMG